MNPAVRTLAELLARAVYEQMRAEAEQRQAAQQLPNAQKKA